VYTSYIYMCVCVSDRYCIHCLLIDLHTHCRGSREVDMLYSQAKSAFLNGELACSRPITCKFAAIELQIQQGNCSEQ
jgi:hypothetical protein